MSQHSFFKIKLLLLLLCFLGNISLQAKENQAYNTHSSDSTLTAYLNSYGIHTTHHNELKLLKSGH